MKITLLLSISLVTLMAAGTMAAETPMQTVSRPHAPQDEKIYVTKASGTNAITVAEAFINGEKLDKKKIVVNGKVVKVSTGIMKRNWVHVQDGTGSRKNRTNNLVCTSKNMVKVGEVVTVSGTLARDRDFGSGYRYKAIIENATFTKQP